MSHIILNTTASADVPLASANKVNVFLDSDGIVKYKNQIGSVVQTGNAPPAVLESTATSGVIVNEEYIVLNPTANASWEAPTAVGRTKPLYLLNKSAFQITFTLKPGQTINGDSTGVFSSGYPYTAQIWIPIGGQWYVF